MPRSAIMTAIRKAIPSVVSIRSIDLQATAPETDEFGVAEDFGEKQLGGSGFIVAPDGLIVTNKHVVPDPTVKYEVILQNTEVYPARVLAHDPTTDIAFVKIAKRTIPALKLGSAKTLELGEEVIAIGNALGQFTNTASAGIVSGLSRSLIAALDQSGATEELEGLIQTDAAINPGNSGGPLINTHGEAVGVNIATVLGAQNVGFAIPIDIIRRDLAELRRYGRIRRGYLGIRYIPITDTIAKEFELPHPFGALIAADAAVPAVVPDSPAFHAGLRENDIIVAMNSEHITPDQPLAAMLARTKVGRPLRLLVLREKKRLRLTVTPVEWQSGNFPTDHALPEAEFERE